MFCIRDVSIRLLLLSHFNSFVHVFEVDELKSHILPELLVGIKDTNNDLVCATLRALADIVPILGGAAVIGGNRGKLFTDGRPNKITRNKNLDDIRKVLTFTQEIPVFMNIDENNVHLAERPSPDGGEDKKEKEFSFIEEECTWSDWETQETTSNSHCCTVEASSTQAESQDNTGDIDLSSPMSESSSNTMKTKYTKKLVISDITELDIKNSRAIKTPKEEFDFFTDMEPVIKKTQILHVPEAESSKSRIFDVRTSSTVLEEHDDTGWGEDLSDLSIDDTHELAVQ